MVDVQWSLYGLLYNSDMLRRPGAQSIGYVQRMNRRDEGISAQRRPSNLGSLDGSKCR
jgi:hypothetical protein